MLEILHNLASATHVMWRSHVAAIQATDRLIIGRTRALEMAQNADVELNTIRNELLEEIQKITTERAMERDKDGNEEKNNNEEHKGSNSKTDNGGGS